MKYEFENEIKFKKPAMRPDEMKVPFYIEDALVSCDVLDKFMSQPDYVKREQINLIEFSNREETKLNRVAGLVSRLAM